MSDLYEPGSVFKLITCAAALDAGAITRHSTFYCGDSISVAGTRFHCANHKRHGSQTVTQALENSCNQSFIQIGARLGKQAFCDYFAAFGLREPTGIDLPAEPKKSLYYTADRMGPVELASCAFGQSSKISYLEMASAVCAVVNGGKLMQPYLVSDILAPDGSVLQHNQPVCRRQVIQPATSATMREMMEAVVLYGGGRNAQIAGYRVGGKSGTSQKLDSADEKARIASFVAVAPIDDPQFLCLVCLDEPHSWTTAGGSLSAPVCAEVLEQTLVYKGVPRGSRHRSADAQAAALPADGDSLTGHDDLNGLRLRSGHSQRKNYLNRAMPERLRTLRHCISREGRAANGRCSAASAKARRCGLPFRHRLRRCHRSPLCANATSLPAGRVCPRGRLWR